MPNFKVLLPTNGFEVGSKVELTQEEADRFNAGEPTPRVELVPETPVAPEPAPEPTEEAPTPPASEETLSPTNDETPPSGEGEGEGEGAGADTGTDANTEGAEAGESNA